jgi:hypothetical protein
MLKNLLAILFLCFITTSAVCQSEPWTYRAAFQPIFPVSEKMGIGGYLNYNNTPSAKANNVSVALPAIQYGINKHFSITWYLMAAYDINNDVANKLELRPVTGIRYDDNVNKKLKLSAWFRLENRFKDISGNYDYTTRARLRGYFDYAIGSRPRQEHTWFMQMDIEPQYNFEKAYFSNLLTRLGFCYIVSKESTLDFRYFLDVTSPAKNVDLSHTGNQFRVTFIKIFKNKKMSPEQIKTFDIDE